MDIDHLLVEPAQVRRTARRLRTAALEARANSRTASIENWVARTRAKAILRSIDEKRLSGLRPARD